AAATRVSRRFPRECHSGIAREMALALGPWRRGDGVTLRVGNVSLRGPAGPLTRHGYASCLPLSVATMRGWREPGAPRVHEPTETTRGGRRRFVVTAGREHATHRDAGNRSSRNL